MNNNIHKLIPVLISTAPRCALCTLLATHVEYVDDHEIHFCDEHRDYMDRRAE